VTQGVSSDEDALAASLAEPARFAVLFERHVDAIHRYLSFRVGSDIAEDLTAETFARAFAGRRRYQVDRGSVKAWLFGIVTNLVRENHRDEQRRIKALALSNEDLRRSTDGAVQVDERLRLAAALASLKPEWRSVVLVVGIGGLSYEETAAALHIPIGTVRSRYSRARTQLAASLADTGEQNVTGDPVP
jgi:RNA polymerase sigma-70 factor (ECF subfamily)